LQYLNLIRANTASG